MELILISITTARSHVANLESYVFRRSCTIVYQTDLGVFQFHNGGSTGSLVHFHQHIVRHQYDHNIDAYIRPRLHYEILLVGRLADGRNDGEFLWM